MDRMETHLGHENAQDQRNDNGYDRSPEDLSQRGTSRAPVGYDRSTPEDLSRRGSARAPVGNDRSVPEDLSSRAAVEYDRSAPVDLSRRGPSDSPVLSPPPETFSPVTYFPSEKEGISLRDFYGLSFESGNAFDDRPESEPRNRPESEPEPDYESLPSTSRGYPNYPQYAPNPEPSRRALENSHGFFGSSSMPSDMSRQLQLQMPQQLQPQMPQQLQPQMPQQLQPQMPQQLQPQMPQQLQQVMVRAFQHEIIRSLQQEMVRPRQQDMMRALPPQYQQAGPPAALPAWPLPAAVIAAQLQQLAAGLSGRGPAQGPYLSDEARFLYNQLLIHGINPFSLPPQQPWGPLPTPRNNDNVPGTNPGQNYYPPPPYQ